MKLVDMTGQRFGRLTVLSRDGYLGCAAAWACLCDCGMLAVKPGTALRAGRVTSCGCFKKEVVAAGANTKHGQRHTTTYKIWCGMKSRCSSPANRAFKDYGGRGISVCERWQDFSNFLADMGVRPAGKTIDRIDNAKGYAPGNCRWATPLDQANNTRRNVRVTHDGKEMTLSEWARHAGLTASLLSQRLSNGWSIARALTEPVNVEKRKHYR